MLNATVNIDLSGLKRFEAAVEQQLAGGTGPIADALKQWAARYRGFLQQEFVRNSKGGGRWPPLKAATVRGRRHGKTKGKGVVSAAILRDTGTLFAVVAPTFSGSPGQLQERIPFGIRVGYGGPGSHPRGRVTVSDIASFHQEGSGNLPKREIIVPPSTGVLAQMREDMKRAIDRLAQ